MLKNIECDYNHGYGCGICCGRKFVATPFVLNYGYAPGSDSQIYVVESADRNGRYVIQNYFANEPVDIVKPEHIVSRTKFLTEQFEHKFFQNTVVKYARPSRYKYSLELPDLWWDIHYATDFDYSMYNYVHILIYPHKTQYRRVRVVASFIGDTKATSINLQDMVLLYDFRYYGPERGTTLVSVCSEHFKHTLDLYRDECYLRLLKHPDRLDHKQYREWLRMDGGRNPDNNKYDKFTVIKTVSFGDALASSLIERIPLANYAE